MSPLAPVRFGDREILVEVVPVPGSEPTSKLREAGRRVEDALTNVQSVILDVAATTAGIVEKLAAQAAEPASIELEFGLKFTAQGGIVMAGVAAESSLTIKVSYAPKREIA